MPKPVKSGLAEVALHVGLMAKTRNNSALTFKRHFNEKSRTAIWRSAVRPSISDWTCFIILRNCRLPHRCGHYGLEFIASVGHFIKVSSKALLQTALSVTTPMLM